MWADVDTPVAGGQAAGTGHFAAYAGLPALLDWQVGARSAGGWPLVTA